jgi:hypothetical protein
MRRYVLYNLPKTLLPLGVWFSRAEFLNLSFWGSYGWHEVHIAPVVSDLLLLLVLTGWVCAVRWLLLSRRKLPLWGIHFLWVCVFEVAATILLTLVATPQEVLPQGRYLFPVMVPIFLLMAGGVCGWLPRRGNLLSVCVIVSGLVALDLYSIWGVVAPAYLS